MKSAQSALEFNQRLASLIERLAQHDIVVSRLQADWGAFGSWEIWAERGTDADRYSDTIMRGTQYPVPAPEVARVTRDGREFLISFATAWPERLSAPRHWTPSGTWDIRDADEAVLQAERLILEHFGGGA